VPPERRALARGRRETREERADRNFAEMLAELRVVQTGVQILLGFLLVLAVQPRFGDATTVERTIYLTTMVLCAVAATLLMAPVPFHRALFGRGRKPELVRVSNDLMRVGLVVLFLALVGAVLLVLVLLFRPEVAITVTVALAVFVALFWFLLPWLLVRRGHRAGHGRDRPRED